MSEGKDGEDRRTDVAVLVVCDDGVGESLVDCDVLFERSGFVEELCLGRIGDSIVETRPEDLGRWVWVLRSRRQARAYLVTELVVAALEFGIRNPDREAVILGRHPVVYALPEGDPELVSLCAKSADPETLLELVADAVDGILEASIAVGVRLDVPGLVGGGCVDGFRALGAAGEGAALHTGGGVLTVGVCSLKLAEGRCGAAGVIGEPGGEGREFGEGIGLFEAWGCCAGGGVMGAYFILEIFDNALEWPEGAWLDGLDGAGCNGLGWAEWDSEACGDVGGVDGGCREGVVEDGGGGEEEGGDDDPVVSEGAHGGER